MPRDVNQRFGARIRELRDRHGWTQEDLGERSGVGREHISKLENGHREACMNIIEQFAKCLGISIEEMMKGV
jgi:transcriptional regulator with XRE-family HTH domain